MTGKHGLAIDNLVQATIVTADGAILTISETSYPDLFWGIRGGGCNFGVVTEFVFQLHPQRKEVFAGPVVFPHVRLAEVTATMEDWQKTQSPEEAALLVVATNGLHPGPQVAVMVFFDGEEEEAKKRFKKIFDLGEQEYLKHRKN